MGRIPIENYRVIRNELEQYSQELAQRPEILVVSKAEIPESEEIYNKLLQNLVVMCC